jgi:hypothetical protein
LTAWGRGLLAGAVNGVDQQSSSALQSVVSDLPATPLAEIARTLLLSNAQGLLNPNSHYWLIPIFFLGLTGLLVGYTEFGGRIANVGMLATWLILPVLLLYAISLVAPVFSGPTAQIGEGAARFEGVIWIAPAFTMFVALGTQVMRRAYGRVGNWLAVGLIIFVIMFWGYRWWDHAQRPINTQSGAAESSLHAWRGYLEL